MADETKSSEELRRDVEQAREELAESVEQLSGKVDPRKKAERAKAQARGLADEAPGSTLPIAVGLISAFLVIFYWYRSKS